MDTLKEREGQGGRGRGGKEREGAVGGGTLWESPFLGKAGLLGAFLSDPQGKVQVGWRVNGFLSEKLIPFDANTSKKKFAYPQFESTNSLVLSLLYCPIPTSVHDY